MSCCVFFYGWQGGQVRVIVAVDVLIYSLNLLCINTESARSQLYPALSRLTLGLLTF